MPIISDAIGAADLIVVPTQPGQHGPLGADAVIGRIEQLGLSQKMTERIDYRSGRKWKGGVGGEQKPR